MLTGVFLLANKKHLYLQNITFSRKLKQHIFAGGCKLGVSILDD